MARAAVLGRLTWRAAKVAEIRKESATACTLVLDVPGWPGHLAGQHVDVRLTAEDGYSTQRSYSIASAAEGDRVELTIQEVLDGEVSSYLAEILGIGDELELRGPIGGYFVWRPDDPAPVLLAGGGSGLVPLMAMVRTRGLVGSRVPFRLIYSVRTPDDMLYADELRTRAREDPGLDVYDVFTRVAPPDSPRPPGRLDLAQLSTLAWPVDFQPLSFVCGPTGFVEAVSDMLVALGHDPMRIKTERFGPTGG
jgi:ferredoxin-NADP reductase